MSSRGGYSRGGRDDPYARAGGDRGRGGGGDRGGRGGGDRGRGGGGDRGRGGRGGGGGAPAAVALSVPKISVCTLPPVNVAGQPKLFGGSRDSRIELPPPPPSASATAVPPAAPAASKKAAAPAPKAGGKAPAAPAQTAKAESLSIEQKAAQREALQKELDIISTSMASVKTLKGGSEGDACSSITNMFPVKSSANTSLYQYDVKLEPEPENTRLKRALVEHFSAEQAKIKGLAVPPILSGSNIIFSSRPLHDASAAAGKQSAAAAAGVIVMSHTADESASGWRKKDQKCIFTFTRTIDPVPATGGNMSTEHYVVLTSIIANAFDRAGLVRIGGKFIDVDAKFAAHEPCATTRDIAGGLALAQGLSILVTPSSRGLLMNADVTIRTVREDTVGSHLQKLAAYAGQAKMSKSETQKLIDDELIGSICVSRYLTKQRKQTFKITKVMHDLTPASVIPGDKKGTTFAGYMKTHHNIVVKDMKQPLLLHESEREKDRDGNNKKLYYLPELASLAGQSEKMRNNADLQQDLKRQCILPKEKRFNSIFTLVAGVLKVKEVAEYLDAWAVTITPKMLEVTGRCLPAPQLQTGAGGLRVDDRNRSWLIAKGAKPKSVGFKPKKWAVMYPKAVTKPELDAFINSLLRDTINGLNANWPAPQCWPYQSQPNRSENLMNEMTQLDEDLEFVLVVLGGKDEKPYEAVKRLALQTWNIPSQCVIMRNVRQADPVKLLNVTSRLGGQMLVKAGGDLWSTNGGIPNTLVVGLSFSSLLPDGTRVASIVACTGDNSTIIYAGTRAFKGQPKDALVTLAGEAMTKFKDSQKRDPVAVVCYRPGLNEGDVPKIVHEEVLHLQSFLKTKHNVGLAFMSGLKRCQMRFYDAKAGFILDTDVLPPTGFNFLMIPQRVTQGTATAMKFTLLSSTATGITGAQLETLTFQQCHAFQAWWGSTREPAVVMYAQRQADLHARLDTKKKISGPTSAPLQAL